MNFAFIHWSTDYVELVIIIIEFYLQKNTLILKMKHSFNMQKITY